jgi:hypothetical protein
MHTIFNALQPVVDAFLKPAGRLAETAGKSGWVQGHKGSNRPDDTLEFAEGVTH